ncbi:hypothetical protein [Leucobacter sp. wl10]|uniref:hypothetical protein n=1 Tax=Leucobacter sp. wl10 TaxID=2304677 RepID=UPI000E5C540B|nr:hypothetical protein [Leucobacter sp. wl10]RGE23200.1 hypothetical protein D1J51_02885 [Leucobacter sp. wl10]
MAPRPHPLPDALGSEFSRASAHAHGVGDHRLRRLDLERPFRGVRRRRGVGGRLGARSGGADEPHPAEIWRDRQRESARAYSTIMLEHQFFVGITAALVRRLPVPAPRELWRPWDRDATARLLDPSDPDHPVNRIEIGVFAPGRAPNRTRVRGVKIQPHLAKICEHDGLRMLDAASLWATLGPRLDLPDRVALGDAIIRIPRIGGNLGPPPRRAYATLDQLVAVAAVKGRIGRSKLLEALPLLREGMASAAESHLRLAIADAGLPEPELDYDVHTDGGMYLGTTEFVYPQFRLAVEYEGDHHRTETGQWNRDIDKQAAYRDAGWETIRVTAEKLYRRRPALIAEIRAALIRRGWRP